jgi:hypothetical protein
MQCHEFEERMHWLLDERQSPHCDTQLLAHARNCVECHQTLRTQEVLFRNLDRGRGSELPPGFAERVVSQVEARPLISRLKGNRRFWAVVGTVVATAAVALLAASLAFNRQPQTPAVPGVAEQATKDSPNSPKSPAADPSPAGGLASDLKSPEASTPDVESLEQYSQAIQSLASQVPHAVERLDEVEEATPGLRPVRTSFTLAIGTIRRTIPPPRKAPPPRKPSKQDSSWLWAMGDQLV